MLGYRPLGTTVEFKPSSSIDFAGGKFFNEEFVYQCIPAWDSVGHMGMIAELEEKFNIEMEMDDIIDFSSYVKGIELLKKYDIKLS